MEDPATPVRKDPVLALLLSACFPGLGYLYVGRTAAFVSILVAEIALFFALSLCPFLLVHLVLAAGAAGAARLRTEYEGDLLLPSRSLLTVGEPTLEEPPAEIDDEPLPPAPPPPPPPPPPLPPGAFDVEGLATELRLAAQEFVAGLILKERYEAQKQTLLGTLPRMPEADVARLLAACAELEREGVLTSHETGLAERYARGT